MRIRKNVLDRYKRELLVCIYFSAALFMLISLLTFNAHDPSWFYYHTDTQPISNKCGLLGAHCAAFLMYLFGAASLLIPFAVCFGAYFILLGVPWRYEWDRIIALLVLIPTVAALGALYRLSFFKHVVPGGRVGIISLRTLFWLFDYVGSIIVLHTLLFVCIILVSRISFLTALRHLSQWLGIVFRKRYVVARWFAAPFTTVVRLFNGIYKQLHSLWKASDVVESDESIVFFEGPLFSEHSTIAPKDFTSQKQPEAKHDPVTQVSVTAASVDQSAQEQKEEVIVSPVHYSVPEDTIFEMRDQKSVDKKMAEELKERAKTLEGKLERFGISGSVTSIRPGPVVTLFEYEPHIDIKISKIIALEDDLALALQAMSIRIIAPIPGKSVVGFEVANQLRKSVYFSSIVQSDAYKKFSGALPLVLGEDTTGSHVIVDLVKMPHLLVAGSTGSGKSVALNTMLISLLCSKNPEELKLILIDPKRLEFAAYADIAHLLFPLITDPRKAVPVLKWVVQTMEERYERMAKEGARTVSDFNQSVHESERMPYIVVVIDELADLMMTAGTDVENLLTRLSQMARAAGIHLIIATQRPSVDVVTGLIKVNFPSRISFKVTSKIDSRTILDTTGAEKLLGKGDMLFLDAGSSVLARVHGAYVSDKEILAVIHHIKAQRPPAYLSIEEELAHDQSHLLDTDDELYQDILSYLEETDEVSISMLQRRFRIGYNRSARIIEALEAQGKIMPADGAKVRKVIRS